MSLRLMYITNKPEVALIAERNGVDRIFVDMEWIGKAERQGKLDSVQNHHTVEDVRSMRRVLTTSELLVRVNPIHDATEAYGSSEEEIEAVIAAGADVLMLPFFKTLDEVQRFFKIVNRRCKTVLLLETAEAVGILDDILKLPELEEIHIGINDLSLSYGKTFMFELLTDGTVERLCRRMELAGVFYGFGGIASLGRGMVPADMIIREHYRIGSHAAILSRSFCNVDKIHDLDAVEEIFFRGIREIRALERECAIHMRYFSENRKALETAVNDVVERMERRKAENACTF